MITNNASAEFGNFQGGIINVTIKCGTNDFHGSPVRVLPQRQAERQQLDAATGRTPPRAGPCAGTRSAARSAAAIFRDKLFFFADYQGIRRANPGAPQSINVIPAEFRNGDFSRLLTEQRHPALQPAHHRRAGQPPAVPQQPDPAQPVQPGGARLFARPTSTRCRSTPACASTRPTRPEHATSSPTRATSSWTGSRATQDYVSVRYSNGRQDRPGINTFPLIYQHLRHGAVQGGRGQLDADHPADDRQRGARRASTASSTTTAARTRAWATSRQKLGIAGVPHRADGAAVPTDGFASNIGSPNIGTQTLFANTTYHYADNLTLIHGRHMMKTGGQVLRQQMNTFYAGNNGRTGLHHLHRAVHAGPNANTPASKGSRSRFLPRRCPRASAAA